MKLEIYPSSCPWVNLEKIDNMNKIDSLRSYFFNKLIAQAPQRFIPPSSTYNTQQAQLGTQTMSGPSRLVTRDLDTQMAFVLACGEPITFLA